jgi:hypothetical protein
MIREIYCRNTNDPDYRPNQLETGDELEALLTKIRMIIFTQKGEVLGYPDLGLSLDKLLFELGVGNVRIQNDFLGQLANFAPEAGKYNVDIQVNFQQGEIRDFCFIDIYIDGSKYLGVVAK